MELCYWLPCKAVLLVELSLFSWNQIYRLCQAMFWNDVMSSFDFKQPPENSERPLTDFIGCHLSHLHQAQCNLFALPKSCFVSLCQSLSSAPIVLPITCLMHPILFRLTVHHNHPLSTSHKSSISTGLPPLITACFYLHYDCVYLILHSLLFRSIAYSFNSIN